MLIIFLRLLTKGFVSAWELINSLSGRKYSPMRIFLKRHFPLLWSSTNLYSPDLQYLDSKKSCGKPDPRCMDDIVIREKLQTCLRSGVVTAYWGDFCKARAVAISSGFDRAKRSDCVTWIPQYRHQELLINIIWKYVKCLGWFGY